MLVYIVIYSDRLPFSIQPKKDWNLENILKVRCTKIPYHSASSQRRIETAKHQKPDVAQRYLTIQHPAKEGLKLLPEFNMLDRFERLTIQHPAKEGLKQQNMSRKPKQSWFLTIQHPAKEGLKRGSTASATNARSSYHSASSQRRIETSSDFGVPQLRPSLPFSIQPKKDWNPVAHQWSQNLSLLTIQHPAKEGLKRESLRLHLVDEVFLPFSIQPKKDWNVTSPSWRPTPSYLTIQHPAKEGLKPEFPTMIPVENWLLPFSIQPKKDWNFSLLCSTIMVSTSYHSASSQRRIETVVVEIGLQPPIALPFSIQPKKDWNIKWYLNAGIDASLTIQHPAKEGLKLNNS
mgnify:CR=1 FL=1